MKTTIKKCTYILLFQDLTISLSTERSDKEVQIIEDQTTLSSINTKAFMDQVRSHLSLILARILHVQ